MFATADLHSLLLFSLSLSSVVARKRIVIDSDGVSDDMQAISLALQHPDIEVLVVSGRLRRSIMVVLQRRVGHLKKNLRAPKMATHSVKRTA